MQKNTESNKPIIEQETNQPSSSTTSQQIQTHEERRSITTSVTTNEPTNTINQRSGTAEDPIIIE